MEEDDSDLLDLLARTDGDLTKPRPVTGSSAGNPSVEIDTKHGINPILTGLFESKFLLGGGGVNLTPPSDLCPEGADRREILHGCEDTSKEYCYGKKNAENGLFIILL